MDHFDYRFGQLHAEDVSLARIANEVGTPFYCYSTATLTRHYRVFADALAGVRATVCFAVKANSNLAVIRTLGLLGAGADVVSEGELRRALAAGIPPERIVLSGVGKKRREMELALDAGILQINVESESELLTLSEVAAARGKRAPIALRINPDVDAGTHEKITTGRKENKFGIEWTDAHRVYRLARALAGLEIVGVAMHIGSQLTDLTPFRNAFLRLRDLALILRTDGIPIRRLDVGGGLGIPYHGFEGEMPPSPAEYGALVQEIFGGLDFDLLFEPGRLLVGNAGVLVTRVLYVKEGASRTFVVVDAAMNDLIRPTLYGAYHAIVPVTEPEIGGPHMLVDVVGPVCETGDTFAVQRSLPPVAPGDLLALRTAGAYGAVMASTYNTRPLVPEVLVKGDALAVVRERPSLEAMLAMDHIPDWLAPTCTPLSRGAA